jgi:YD repeat-containing protein
MAGRTRPRPGQMVIPSTCSLSPLKVPIDPNGNLASKTEGSDVWTYTWNAENELARVEKNGVEIARFAYDPAGRRVEKVVGGVTTSYTYDSEDIVREIRGGTALKYVQGPNLDEPLGADDGATPTYFHADALGSVVKTTNTAGAVTFTRQYDAWGNLQAGSDQPGYAFTGREWDPEAGLYFCRARYYDARAVNSWRRIRSTTATECRVTRTSWISQRISSIRPG